MDIDLEELAAMVEILKQADFSEWRYEKGDLRIVVRRGSVSPEVEVPHAASAPVAKLADRAAGSPQSESRAPVILPESTEQVSAPLLGTFYSRPKPGEPPFVKLGDRVEPDTVLCIVEVMKLMNSVHAGCSGVVVAIYAEDGQLVEFGEPLFSIAPGAA